MSNDPKTLLAAKFLDSFLREIVLDTAIHTHAKIKRARSICHLCGVRCQAHTPAAEQPSSNNGASLDISSTASRSATPVPGSTSTAPHKPDYYSNNPLFECLVCSRQVSSNRYATHLAKCMGMGSKGGRKGAARNAKAAMSSLTGSSRQSGAGTPRYASDADDDSFAKRKNGSVVTGKNGVKRGSSPLAASTLANARMNKRIKTSSPTPPPSDSLGTGMSRSYSSQPFAPSGLSNSTVLSGSPLNPNNTTTPLNGKASPAKNGSKNAASPKKRKRLIDDDEEDDDDGGADLYHDASDGDSNEEEGEISDDDNDDDDDEDVALAAGSVSSRPPGNGTKIQIPLRSTPSSTPKPKTFIVADDSDSDTVLSTNRKSHQALDDDDDEDDDDDDDADDDDDEDDADDDDDDVQVSRAAQGRSAGTKSKKPSASSSGNGGLQRERGSDGEFIDVESASDQSDADSF
ncbi:hypothetical protein EX895_004061 [Sporisorium graminicola]|uniref:SAGA-associated factor 11 n=1 Tax=Sporisorium graminicola TaxID=280036 RepID=A0A4U7KSB1_9BASI|nr:hypothetical protein EX895_004061 [Sporisorium graminicola]TKY87384.1 hypothetical protein EX895_004061 [Sporisorium graminicola]